MDSANYQVRRAVIDDLPGLVALWQGMEFSAEELEKRLTDFQVATDGQGNLLGAVALEIAGQQGRIHHEAFGDFGLAERLRPLLWKKIQAISASHGLFRLWTQEAAPFWKQLGLQPVPKELLQKLPAKWSNTQGGWLALQLKDEAAIQVLSSEVDVELLMKAERASTQKTLEQARMIKQVATVMAIILALFVGAMIFYAISRDPTLMEKLRQR